MQKFSQNAYGKRGNLRKKRKLGPPLEPAFNSKQLFLQLEPAKVGMFRFLLEAYEHIAYFSVINKQKAVLKIVYSPHREKVTLAMLAEIGESLEIKYLPWPFSKMSND